MTEDQYILSTINKYQIFGDIDNATKIILEPLLTSIKQWANNFLIDVYVSGSRAKGTAISLSSDIDLFISLNSQTPETLKQIYDSLYTWLVSRGVSARKQNVSIGINYEGHSIDLIPAKNHSGHTNDHSLYKSKTDTWTKTNIHKHIGLIQNSGRILEIVAFKIWAKRHNLDFPSIYLELTVLNALYNRNGNQVANNFRTVLNYLKNSFVDTLVIDPANSNNIISDDLYKYEKQAIANKADESLKERFWEQIIW